MINPSLPLPSIAARNQFEVTQPSPSSPPPPMILGSGSAPGEPASQSPPILLNNTALNNRPNQNKPQSAETAIRKEELVRLLQTNINIDIDAETQIVITRLINADNEEVIRQIPPETMLKIARYLLKKEETPPSSDLKGLFINERA